MSDDPYDLSAVGRRLRMTPEQRYQTYLDERVTHLERRIATLEQKVAAMQECAERGGVPPGHQLPNPNPTPPKR